MDPKEQERHFDRKRPDHDFPRAKRSEHLARRLARSASGTFESAVEERKVAWRTAKPSSTTNETKKH